MLDPHIRLRLAELQSLQAQHLHSEIEDELSCPPHVLCGFTEWRVTRGKRALSFGWDWTYRADAAQLLGNWSSLRTNVLMLDEHGVELGGEPAWLGVARLMDRSRWQRVLAEALHLHLHAPAVAVETQAQRATRASPA
mgnify:CR=1 FL=1